LFDVAVEPTKERHGQVHRIRAPKTRPGEEGRDERDGDHESAERSNRLVTPGRQKWQKQRAPDKRKHAKQQQTTDDR
jgi:hypothetical protein